MVNDVSLTYGYITKNTRITNALPKEHRIDAYCITNNINANLSDTYYYQKKYVVIIGRFIKPIS